MRNLLFVIMIVGMVAGIGVAYFMLNERNEAVDIKNKAVIEKETAEKKMKEAQSERDVAKKDKEKAELKMYESITKMNDANARASGADAKVAAAEQEKNNALVEARTAKDERNTMETEKDVALKKAEDSENARQEAEGKADRAAQLQEQAEQKSQEYLAKMTELEKEVADIKSDDERGKAVANFVIEFTNNILSRIEEGDDTLRINLDGFLNATTAKEKGSARTGIANAKKKYLAAQEKINTLRREQPLTEIPEEIITRVESSIRSNNYCIDEIVKFLNKKRNPGEMGPEDKSVCEQVVINKDKADRGIKEACEKVIILMNAHKQIFTKKHLKIIEEVTEKYKKWLQPGGEVRPAPPSE